MVFIHGFRGSYLSTWGELANFLTSMLTLTTTGMAEALKAAMAAVILESSLPTSTITRPELAQLTVWRA